MNKNKRLALKLAAEKTAYHASVKTLLENAKQLLDFLDSV